MLSAVDKFPTVVGCRTIRSLDTIMPPKKIKGQEVMNFNEKLIELRKSKGLPQDELGQRLGVSRQTIFKWELAQSYPNFQRLVLLSDYFSLSLDALVKDIDVQDVREKNLSEKQLSAIYDDVQNAKSTINTIFNGLAIFGVVGVLFFLLLGIILR